MKSALLFLCCLACLTVAAPPSRASDVAVFNERPFLIAGSSFAGNLVLVGRDRPFLLADRGFSVNVVQRPFLLRSGVSVNVASAVRVSSAPSVSVTTVRRGLFGRVRRVQTVNVR